MTIRSRMVAGLLTSALLSIIALAACSPEAPAILTVPGQSCGQDVSTDAVKGTVERVGGLSTDDYTVTFAQGTPAGVVVLVEGDAERALDDVAELPGLGIVAEASDIEDPGTISGFAQVQQIVDDTCGS